MVARNYTPPLAYSIYLCDPKKLPQEQTLNQHSMLEIRNLNVTTNNKTILKEINLSFETGKVYAIMGPNGSGKSTLAHTILGSPQFTVNDRSRILFNSENITHLPVHERAKHGIFLSFQSPLAIGGVTAFQLLRVALSEKLKPLELKNKVDEYAKRLNISRELLSRPLNVDFSGGERKKMELLQMAVLEPQFCLLDEIDAGVDVDALKTITMFLNEFRTPERTFVIITHYTRILKHVEPDEVIVIKDGSVVMQSESGSDLAHTIEEHGYDAINAS